jgi:hypothetical protein
VTIRPTNPIHDFVSGESSMRQTRTASIATIAIALGLALTAVGVNRGLPHEIGGIGSKLTVGADTWASGTAISPPLVFLVVAGLLAAITMRSTRGGARAASWLAVLTSVAIVAGLMEPVQQRVILFQDHDPLLAVVLYASYLAWIALVVAAVVRRRQGGSETVAPAPTGSLTSGAVPAAA